MAALLKTIHFLTEAELVPPTPENITKTYLSDIQKYYEIKPEIDKALNILVDAKILIVANNIYKITSDLETKLLDEMNEFIVELFIKKRNLINHIKKSKTLKNISSVSDNNMQYPFNVLSDLDDEIFPSSNKRLEIRLHSLYSITEDREEFIQSILRQVDKEIDFTSYDFKNDSGEDKPDGIQARLLPASC